MNLDSPGKWLFTPGNDIFLRFSTIACSEREPFGKSGMGFWRGFFTCRMFFLSPSQQYKSIEGNPIGILSVVENFNHFSCIFVDCGRSDVVAKCSECRSIEAKACRIYQ